MFRTIMCGVFFACRGERDVGTTSYVVWAPCSLDGPTSTSSSTLHVSQVCPHHVPSFCEGISGSLAWCGICLVSLRLRHVGLGQHAQ